MARTFAIIRARQRVDGVLLFNTNDASAETMQRLLDRSLLVVLVERRSPGPAVDAVLSDNRAAPATMNRERGWT